ncbi:MAG: hypothetical protein AAFW76_10950, partial [Pseudomonadota bacterium]
FRAGVEVEVNEDGGLLDSVNVVYNDPELEPFEAESIDVSLEWYNRPGSRHLQCVCCQVAESRPKRSLRAVPCAV